MNTLTSKECIAILGLQSSKGYKVNELREMVAKMKADQSNNPPTVKTAAAQESKASVTSLNDIRAKGIKVRIDSDHIKTVTMDQFKESILSIHTGETVSTQGKNILEKEEVTQAGYIQGIAAACISLYPGLGLTAIVAVKGKGDVPCREAVKKFIDYRETELDSEVKRILKDSGVAKPTLPTTYRNVCSVIKSAMLAGINVSSDRTFYQVNDELKATRKAEKEAEIIADDPTKISESALKLSLANILQRGTAMHDAGELTDEVYQAFRTELAEMILQVHQVMNDWLDNNRTETVKKNLVEKDEVIAETGEQTTKAA